MPENEEQFVQRRLLMASLLSAAAMMAYFYFFRPPSAPVAPPEEQAVEAPAAQPAEPQPAPQPAAAEPAEEPAAEGEQPVQAVAAEAEREITVDTNAFQVVFSNRGGIVKHWILKDFTNALGEPLDLVHQQGAKDHGYPFRFQLSGGEPVTALDDVLFTVNDGPDRRTGNAVVEFRYADNIRTASKTFRFRQDGNLLDVSSELTENGAPRLHLLAWPGGFGDTAHLKDYANSATFFFDPAEDKVVRNTASSAEDARLSNQGEYPFAGVEDLFFAAVFRPRENQPVQVETGEIEIDPLTPNQDDQRPFAALAIGSATGNDFELYVGPKNWDRLMALDPRMASIINFGWFSFVAKPLFLMLRWTYANVVGNWGWSIMLVTIAINFVLFPLKWKGNKSAKRMQQIQPLIKQINEKYKGLSMTDPKKQEQNEEMMELYKKYGVNPLGGCFPMILQLPFFYGFYMVLTQAIEIRGAEWLWVSDLSQPEQLAIRILPLTMMAAQFWMQHLTPTPSADPAQARIMKFMPLMMGFIFYQFQAGLVLYWLTGNLVGIAQQVVLNKMPGEPLEVETPVRRPGRKSKKK